MKKILHTECDCLFAKDIFDSECRKRWFHVNDLENNEFKYIGICNQHLSLLINKEVMKHRRTWDANRRRIYTDIVKEIISNYINTSTSDVNIWGKNKNYNDLTSKSIVFNICDRPYIFRDIKLVDCIELYLKNGSWLLRDKIVDVILGYLDSNTLYKKYKTKYKNIIVLCKRLQRTYGKERENIINEILTNILELQTKSQIDDIVNIKRKMIRL